MIFGGALIVRPDVSCIPESLFPGSHLLAFWSQSESLEARKLGFELRDTLLLLLPGKEIMIGLLYRKPIMRSEAENVLEFGTGALNIPACKRPSGGDLWNPNEFQPGMLPTNVLLVHSETCSPGRCSEDCPVTTIVNDGGDPIEHVQVASFKDAVNWMVRLIYSPGKKILMIPPSDLGKQVRQAEP